MRISINRERERPTIKAKIMEAAAHVMHIPVTIMTIIYKEEIVSVSQKQDGKRKYSESHQW